MNSNASPKLANSNLRYSELSFSTQPNVMGY
jgi:hypothetical protein